jgi:hypothetical protein
MTILSIRTLLVAGILLSGCAPAGSVAPAACTPTDQDQYVYHPARLTVLKDCVVVEGIVDSIKAEDDGDLHIRIRPDRRYDNLLNDVNEGLLVVEPICVNPATRQAAKLQCDTDKTPVDVSALRVGQHVRMEGRWVTDTLHGWNELHPLYRVANSK